MQRSLSGTARKSSLYLRNNTRPHKPSHALHRNPDSTSHSDLDHTPAFYCTSFSMCLSHEGLQTGGQLELLELQIYIYIFFCLGRRFNDMNSNASVEGAQFVLTLHCLILGHHVQPATSLGPEGPWSSHKLESRNSVFLIFVFPPLTHDRNLIHFVNEDTNKKW